mmetsp:Transcript_23554/g.58512  ORF Transcript_23554/g.58512 Transcript_23554/m.58512 type:complete len:123 (-) Transcript_23554:62-430(-)
MSSTCIVRSRFVGMFSKFISCVETRPLLNMECSDARDVRLSMSVASSRLLSGMWCSLIFELESAEKEEGRRQSGLVVAARWELLGSITRPWLERHASQAGGEVAPVRKRGGRGEQNDISRPE